MDNKKNNENYVYNYTCPNCNEILSEVENCNYCPECRNAIETIGEDRIRKYIFGVNK